MIESTIAAEASPPAKSALAAGLALTVFHELNEFIDCEGIKRRTVSDEVLEYRVTLSEVVKIIAHRRNIRFVRIAQHSARLAMPLPTWTSYPRRKARAVSSNVLSPQELRKLIDASADPYGLPIMFAAFTGCRQAEGTGLQWGDIDWNRRTAEIHRQWRRGAFYEPKTKSSRRTVELPDELVSALKRWKLRCPKGEHDLVFPGAKGQPMPSSDLLRTGLHAALRRAELRQVRFHDLRHSFASNLLGAGTDIVTVSKALGHANVHITLTTYAHAIPRGRQGAGDAGARLMGQSGNQNGNI
jgi:integrase